MILNQGTREPIYAGGGGTPQWAYPRRGIGSAVYREIARFTLKITRLVGFVLER